MSQSIKSISRLKVSKSISLGDNGDISKAGLTDTQRVQIELTREIIVSQGSFLPPVEDLKQIEALSPGSATKLIDDSLLNSAHLRNFEMTQLIGKINLLKRGQYFAFGAIFLILSFSSLAAWLNYPIIAGSLGTTTIIAVVGAYLYDRRGGAKPPENNTPPKTIIVTPDSP